MDAKNEKNRWIFLKGEIEEKEHGKYAGARYHLSHPLRAWVEQQKFASEVTGISLREYFYLLYTTIY